MYHQGPFTPHGAAHRSYGPLHRFDTHTPDPPGPQVCPDGRSVLYVGEDLATSASEVFGEAGEARLCPRYRVALLRPTKRLLVQDLVSPGAAMSITALPAVSDGALPRELTQEWARAISEDQPSGPVRGIAYHSAYNAGLALALWNCEDSVETVTASGVEQDFPLATGAMYGRLVVAMRDRHIDVSVVGEAACRECSRR